MTIPELAALLETVTEGQKPPPYRAKQIFSWITQGASGFSEMTNLPPELKKTLEAHAVIRQSTVYKKQCGSDGTIKLTLRLFDGSLIETVLLSSSNRYTACLSTQAGCPLACVFCKTGTMGFLRNLEASEIVEQFLFLNDELVNMGDEQKQKNRISNIVIMGMGEPMLNLPALRKALEILSVPSGFGLSKRKITVSTAGICEGIIDMAKNGPEAELAVSLTSAREELRRRLMPGASKYTLAELKDALFFYQKFQGRRITLEMVLLGGINTGPHDARSLIEFAANIDVVINLIPWNPVSALNFEGKKLRQCGKAEIDNFTGVLEKGGLKVTRRYRRGRGIGGACGQLNPNLPHRAQI
jgi:23S rRNA (adenine2503-C2)-methyltransferase